MRRVLFFILLCLPILIKAQTPTRFLGDKESPISLSRIDMEYRKNITTLPPFDVQKLIEEDKLFDNSDIPYRFGKAFDVYFTLKDGDWIDQENGRVWCKTFRSEGAYSINFIFNGFHLPPNGELYIVNEDKTILYGPVLGEYIPEDGFFMTDVLPGSMMTILLFEPYEEYEKSTLTIKRVVHGYRRVFTGNRGFGDSLPCNNDVKDYPNYNKEYNAVGMVLLESGEEWCSGSLVMTTDYSFKKYFLSAFHCIDYPMSDSIISTTEKASAEKWMFKFNYKKDSSGGYTSSYTYNGAYLRASWYHTDFALLELKNNFNINHIPSWLGWDRDGSTPTSGASIHHPRGDVMKISFENSAFTNGISYNSDHWRVIWDSGVTEPGSSGSPILNESRRVVGQLHGGAFPTGGSSNNYDEYGKLSVSWTGNGNDSTRLSNWLDPLGFGTQTVNTMYAHEYTINGNSQICGTEIYSMAYPAGCNIVWGFEGEDTIYNNYIQYNPNNSGSCLILNPNNNYVSGVLKATVFRSGSPLKSCTKYISTAYDFSGYYTQIGGYNYDTMCYYPYLYQIELMDESIIAVTELSDILVTSDYFLDADITISGYQPSQWYVSNGTLFMRFPILPRDNDGIPIIQFAKLLCKCRNSCRVVQLDIFILDGEPLRDSSQYSIGITSAGKDFIVSFMDSDNTEVENRLISSDDWNLTIRNIATGTVVCNEHVTHGSTLVRTSGWPPGIYLVQGTKDGKTLTKKISVNKR